MVGQLPHVVTDLELLEIPSRRWQQEYDTESSAGLGALVSEADGRSDLPAVGFFDDVLHPPVAVPLVGPHHRNDRRAVVNDSHQVFPL